VRCRGMDAMVRHVRWIALLLLIVLGMFPAGCQQEAQSNSSASPSPRIRVRLFEDTGRVSIHAFQTAHATLEGQNGERLLAFPKNGDLTLCLTDGAWHLASATIGQGILTIRPAASDALRVNGGAYRGYFKFVPVGDGKFDVINDVDIDDYLKGVVPAEMYHNWHSEAYKAQAVASRTYALYEAHSAGVGRYWDVYPDERSQMYGGVSAENKASSDAVETTTGVVLTYGDGDGKIFKAYFCSCCGGISQAAVDAFPGEKFIPPLGEQYRGLCCSASKYYNWGPITIKKSELTRRFHLWAEKQARTVGRPVAELNMTDVYRVDVQAMNRYGRPTRILISDSHGLQYNWSAEELRAAVNTDAQSGTTLPSSFCRINGNPNSDSVTFFDGHGFGHGVGMCQWCAESMAACGGTAGQILLQSYPHAKLVRAY
jgi:stage II sporulation protein D